MPRRNATGVVAAPTPAPGCGCRPVGLTFRVLSPLLGTCAMAALVTGCSLLTVKVPGKAMTQTELNARVLTFDYADSFQATVTRTADQIAAGSSDPAVQLAALRWKIEATAASRHAATRSAPMLALLDSWALAAQMREFVDEGAGARLFGTYQGTARSTAVQLERDIAGIAATVTTKSELERYQTFVDDYVRSSPLTSLDFKRASIVDRWWAQAGKHPALLSTVGTAPEVMSDFEESLRLYADDLPSETFWQAQLALRQNENDPAANELRRTMGRIDDSLADIGAAASESPELVRGSVAELRGTLFMGLDRLDRSREEVMRDMSAEREALTRTADYERATITNDVDLQRAALTRDAARIANQALETSWRNVRGLVRELALFGLAAMIVGLGLPFAAGYWVGVARTRPKS